VRRGLSVWGTACVGRRLVGQENGRDCWYVSVTGGSPGREAPLVQLFTAGRKGEKGQFAATE
jgi:hypothetical protein